ncbi:MAG TPA: hypothetical protein VD966_03050, partial [Pyrinomonadaceae bacterium]|nr:hypothetical protein [Pyrinomonadaceae bacterium]
MKRCPTCNRTYTDDALSFCLDDGAPLLGVGDPSSSFDPNATMRYPAPRETTPPPTQAYRPDPPLVNQVAQPAWSPTPSRPYAPPTRKSSPLPWIIGGVVVLIVLGVGLIVLIAILASIGSNSNTGEENFNRSSANSNRADRNSNSRSSTSNSSTRTNENTGGS